MNSSDLNDGDLDFPQGILKVRGKGRKERLAPLGSYAAKALKAWLAVRKLAKTRTARPRGAGVHESFGHTADHAQRGPDARESI